MNTITPTRRGLLAAAIVSLAALVAASTTQAAVITWGAPTGISGDSDVSANGTLVGAFNTGAAGVSNTTINGTTFTGLVMIGTNVTSGDFNLAITGATFSSFNGFGSANAPFSNLSSNYQALLSSAGGDFTTQFTLTMSNLVVGQTYEFQWWASRSNGANSQITTATAGNTVALNSQVPVGDGNLGQFAIGAFIADNASQQIVFDSPSLSTLNGFQLRQLGPVSAIPEPGSALVGMLALGLCGARLGRRTRP